MKNILIEFPNIIDETKIHNYTLIIPPIKFGFPFPEGVYKGKVFATYGRSDNYYVKQFNNNYLKTFDANFITDENVLKLNEYTKNDETVIFNIRNYFNTLNDNITFVNESNNDGKSIENCIFNTTKYFIFPIKQKGILDITILRYIARCTSEYIFYVYIKQNQKQVFMENQHKY